jgi:hypothetical protein
MSGEIYINTLIRDIDNEIHKVFPSRTIIDSLANHLVELGVYPYMENIAEIVMKHGAYWFLVPGVVIYKNRLGRSMITYSQ